MAIYAFLVELVVGATFIYSGLAKLPIKRFAVDVSNYELLPDSLVPLVAQAIPSLELAVGGFILLGLGASVPLWLAATLLAIFAVAISVNLWRGKKNSCGCQGSAKPISRILAVRNLALAGVTAVAAGGGEPLTGLRVLMGSNGDLSAGTAAALLCVLLLLLIAVRLAESCDASKDRLSAPACRHW